MKKEITEENKTLILKAEKVFPEVWKFMQREANRDTPMEDVLFALERLKRLFDRDGHVQNPWGFLETVIKTKQEKENIVEREEAWDRKKIKHEEDVKKWLESFLTK